VEVVFWVQNAQSCRAAEIDWTKKKTQKTKLEQQKNYFEYGKKLVAFDCMSNL
jgi:hypothetical protein